ncbi:hypothetical protein BG910_10085 [Neisseria chenwenguii]|uniref:Uncharacterized protein n=1 Tax=Neisseria chenwenguii TaxID=1853278 RepID=A0A220S3I1_9NEIS|nr:hypothetical protein BG910_10085 [Neisseria chenwenguii]ROV57181.1 hypothetical protein EGS38_00345 [Neisseria chenwenguii]
MAVSTVFFQRFQTCGQTIETALNVGQRTQGVFRRHQTRPSACLPYKQQFADIFFQTFHQLPDGDCGGRACFQRREHGGGFSLAGDG